MKKLLTFLMIIYIGSAYVQSQPTRILSEKRTTFINKETNEESLKPNWVLHSVQEGLDVILINEFAKIIFVDGMRFRIVEVEASSTGSLVTYYLKSDLHFSAYWNCYLDFNWVLCTATLYNKQRLKDIYSNKYKKYECKTVYKLIPRYTLKQ